MKSSTKMMLTIFGVIIFISTISMFDEYMGVLKSILVDQYRSLRRF